MTSGVYCGPNKALTGRTAILRQPIVTKGEPLTCGVTNKPMIMAQFDYLPSIAGLIDPAETIEFKQDPYGYLCHGWHPFTVEDFKIDVP